MMETLGHILIGVGIGYLIGYCIAWYIHGVRVGRRLDADAVEQRRHADLTRALGRDTLPTGQTGPPSRINRADMRAARIDEEGDLH